MSPSAPSVSSTPLPESEWPTPPSCPGSPLCEPSSAASAPTTSLTASSLAPGNAPNTCDYVFHTTKGDVTVRAFRSLSPAGADRLHTLVRHGFYDGSPLYRILPGFVAQWGVAAEPSLATVFDWRNDVSGSILPDEQPNPDGPGNDKLWVSYSSSYDTATNPPTATNRTAELFLNLVDNKAKLDGKSFVPFAKVVKGMEVVDTWYAGYGEMDGACGLHLDGGWVCHGPNETDLYAGGAGTYRVFPKSKHCLLPFSEYSRKVRYTVCRLSRVQCLLIQFTRTSRKTDPFVFQSQRSSPKSFQALTESATSRPTQTHGIPIRAGTTGTRSTTSRGATAGRGTACCGTWCSPRWQ